MGSSWSVAEGEWDEDPCLAIRWKGSDSEPGVGNPQSRDHATWFVIPGELEVAIRRELELLSSQAEMVVCDINQPDGYDFGAWRVQAKLSPQVVELLGNNPLVFPFPNLPYRIFSPDQGYVCPVNGELRGRFSDGTWLGHIYTNGIPEAENPTTIEVVRAAFVQNITEVLKKILPVDRHYTKLRSNK